MPWTCSTSHPLFYLLPSPSFVSLIALSLPPGEPGWQSSAAGTAGRGCLSPRGWAVGTESVTVPPRCVTAQTRLRKKENWALDSETKNLQVQPDSGPGSVFGSASLSFPDRLSPPGNGEARWVQGDHVPESSSHHSGSESHEFSLCHVLVFGQSLWPRL